MKSHCTFFVCPVMTCHFASGCQDTVNGTSFPAQSIEQCCSVGGSSISFTAASGTCQPCISKCCIHVCTMYSFLAAYTQNKRPCIYLHMSHQFKDSVLNTTHIYTVIMYCRLVNGDPLCVCWIGCVLYQ